MMNEESREQPPRFRFTKLFWIGVVIFAVGCGPLLVFGLFVALGLNKDPNPNPVGLGMLAFFTFYPSLGLMLGGLVTSIRQWRSSHVRAA
jgi:hypothetical protein